MRDSKQMSPGDPITFERQEGDDPPVYFPGDAWSKKIVEVLRDIRTELEILNGGDGL